MKTSMQKLEDFFAQFKTRHYEKREIILRADEEPRGVCYLKKGYVRLYSVSEEGEDLTLIIFKPEDFFPIRWAINKITDPYYLEAMTTVEILQAPREEFVLFLKANGDVFFELTTRILVRLGGLLQRMEYLAFGNAYQKIASMLSICAERFGKKEINNIIIQVSLTHKDIANLVGLTRETASIEIKKLEKKGIIGYHGRSLVVKNIKKLRKESLLENL